MACKQEVLNLSITSDIITTAVKSFALSKRYTQIMVRLSILNILHQRLVLNESDLKIKKYEGTPFMVFKRKTAKDPLLCQYLAWAKGISDAIDKNYLKEIFLLMRDPSNDELVESYKFRLKYNIEESKENRHTPPGLKKATLELLQVLYELGKCNKLMEKTVVHLELTYYDITPENYEPPGFEVSEEKYCLSIPSCKNHLATLKTGFHKMSCYGGGPSFERPFTPVISSEIMMTEEDQRIQEALCASTVDNEIFSEVEETQVIPKRSGSIKVPTELNISNITVSDRFETNVSIASGQSGSVVLTEEYFSCICQLPVSSDLLDVDPINCVACKRQYHAPCHGYLNKDDVCEESFTCIYCDTNDRMFLQFNPVERPMLARVRLILYSMNKLGKLPINIMKLLCEKDKIMVIQKLESFNLLNLTKGENFEKINKTYLSQVLTKFFPMENSQLLQ